MAISQAIAGNIKPLHGGRFNPMLSRTSARRGGGRVQSRRGWSRGWRSRVFKTRMRATSDSLFEVKWSVNGR